MKINQLHLFAFGGFTDVTLDFSSPIPGLHVVYGPNEAGKSTALRGLLALLFGFPTRTPDNFLHAYSQLLVGGSLLGSDGSEFFLRRRKKMKNDLFDVQDNPLNAEVLTPFLRGLDQETFSRMHGIDHERLVQGGQGILEQQGEVGQALFSAGTGFASIRNVLSALEQEADLLFRPRSSKTELGQALIHYKELQTRMRQCILSSSDWKKHHQALTLAQSRYQDLTLEYRELARNVRVLEQLRQALPYIAQLQDVQEKLQALGTVQVVPEDFLQHRLELEEGIRLSRVELDGLWARHKTCLTRLAQLQPDAAILEHADLIEDLQQRLGEYRKAQTDRPRLEGQRISYKTEASRILHVIRPELPLEQVDILRPVLAKRKAIQALEQEYALANQALLQSQKQVREVGEELKRLHKERDELSQHDDVHTLAQSVALAHKAGDLDLRAREIKTELEQRKKHAASCLQSLGLWSGAMEALPGLAVPLEETIAGFAADLDRVEEQVKEVERDKKHLESEHKTLMREMQLLEQGSNVPELAKLHQYRKRRDQGWQLVQRAWLGYEDVDHEAHSFDPVRPLAKAYTASVVDADEFADTMYKEAERIQKYTALTARLKSVRQEQEAYLQKQQELAQGKAELLDQWQHLWRKSDIHPLSPREMQAWLDKLEIVRALARDIIRLEKEVQDQEERRQEMIGLLYASLVLPVQENLSFTLVLHQAEIQLEDLRKIHSAREALVGVVHEKERFLAQCQFQENEARKVLQGLQEHWESVMDKLGFPPATQPGEASDHIEILQKMFVALDEAHTLEARQKGIDRDAQNFEISVRELAEKLELQEESQDLGFLVTRLKSRLQHALREQAVQEQQHDEIVTLEKEISDFQARQKAEEEGLELFLAQIGVSTVQESIVVEERWHRSQVLRARMDELDATLASIAQGKTVADLKALALTWEGQDLDGHIQTLQESLEQLEPEMQTLAEDIGREKHELSQMDGADSAARLNEDLEAELSKISRITQNYIQTMVAAFVLRQEIEHYRQQYQNPLLAKASDIFQTLTLGSFVTLRTDLDESDRPILLGVRSHDQRVPVEGMSSGTRDQLYLALRLASLVQQAELSGPMPFIVDDVLINFDENRIQATLQVLAELGEQFQIIMFTHQAIVRDFAANLGRDDRVFIHHL